MGKIVVTIPKSHKGNTSVEVKGVCGQGCKELTRAIEEALGDQKSQEETDEANQQEKGEELHETA